MEILHQVLGQDFYVLQKSVVRKLGADKSLLFSLLIEDWKKNNYATEFELSVDYLERELCIKKKTQIEYLKEFCKMDMLKIYYKGLPRKRYISINEKGVFSFLNLCNPFVNHNGAKMELQVGQNTPSKWGENDTIDDSEQLIENQLDENSNDKKIPKKEKKITENDENLKNDTNIIYNNIYSNINNNKDIYNNINNMSENLKNKKKKSSSSFVSAYKKIELDWIKIANSGEKEIILGKLDLLQYKREHLLLASKFWLLLCMKNGNENKTLQKSSIHTWVETIRLLMEVDNYSLRRLFAICYYMNHCYRNKIEDFWFENIMSITAFRSKTKNGEYYMDKIFKNANNFFNRNGDKLKDMDEFFKIFENLL